MLAILLPRLLRPAQAAAYLGVGTTIFARDIRPHLIEIRMGAGGVAFDRLDVDEWADQHKARTGRPAGKGTDLWDVQERPASSPVTSHYSVAELGELIAATGRICTAKGAPSITLLRVASR